MNAHFSFHSASFIDSPEVLAETVNGIAGHALSTWLAGALGTSGLTTSQIWAEDHGWDFAIDHAGARYLCACSLATEDGPPFEGHIALAKQRSLWDRVRGRNGFATDDAVAARILDLLQRHPDVSRLETHHT